MRLMLVQSSPRLGAVEANLAAVQSAVEGAAFDLLRLPELFAPEGNTWTISAYLFRFNTAVVKETKHSREDLRHVIS
ncbi:hypothetical protein ES703_118748 [subsurface metagenome]